MEASGNPVSGTSTLFRVARSARHRAHTAHALRRFGLAKATLRKMLRGRGPGREDLCIELAER